MVEEKGDTLNISSGAALIILFFFTTPSSKSRPRPQPTRPRPTRPKDNFVLSSDVNEAKTPSLSQGRGNKLKGQNPLGRGQDPLGWGQVHEAVVKYKY